MRNDYLIDVGRAWARFGALLLVLVCLGFIPQATAQTQTTLTGVVSDEQGEPLISASVVVIDPAGKTVTGVATAADGSFRLQVDLQPGYKLRISYAGFVMQEYSLDNGQTNFAVVMGYITTEETVVTALGIERQKRSLGYATSTVSNEDLTDVSRANALDAISGIIPGVTISRASSGVNGSNRILIRGTRSFLGNNQPLFVVDGVIIDNGDGQYGSSTQQASSGNRANDLNPDDIESINVLRGPQAAALYGGRAYNGVVIITLKKGTAGKVQVNYTGSVAFDEPLKLPDIQTEFGQGYGLSSTTYVPEFDPLENWHFGPRYDGQPRDIGPYVNGSYLTIPYSYNDEYLSSFFRTGVTYKNSVSISGGNSNSTYYLSIGNVKQSGIQYQDEFQRYNVTLNSSFKLSDKFTSSASFTYNYNTTNTTPAGPLNGNNTVAYQAALQAPSVLRLGDYQDIYNNPRATLDGWAGGYYDNPFWYLNSNRYEDELNRLIARIELQYSPLSWLKFTGRVGMDHYDQREFYREQIQDYQGLATGDPNGYNGGYNGSRSVVSGYEYAGFGNLLNLTSTEITTDLFGTVTRDLTPDLNLVATVGYQANTRVSKSGSLSAPSGWARPGNFDISQNRQGVPTVGDAISERYLLGAYADVLLGYKEYLYLNANFRNDWSSTLGGKAFSYYSASLSFVFTDAFELQSEVLSYGKLRASVGQTGNDPAAYQTNRVYALPTAGFPFGSQIGFEEGNTLIDPNLKPESVTSYEGGFELGFFDGRLGVDFTAYLSISEDQIINAPIAPSSGYSAFATNIGRVDNRGLEVLVTGEVFRNPQGFSWTVAANFSTNRNEVKEIGNGLTRINISTGGNAQIAAIVGNPFPLLVGNAALRDPDGNIVVGTNGVPLVAPEQKILGQIQPKYTVGITNTFKYKRLSLSAFVDIRQGNVLSSALRNNMSFNGRSLETAQYDHQPILWPGSVIQNSDGTFSPNTANFITTDDHLYANSAYLSITELSSLVDADVVRLREVVLAYDLPTTLFQNSFIRSAKVSVFANNLFLWVPETNQFVDPEVNGLGTGNAQGLEIGNLPSTRSIGGSISINF